MKKIIWTLIIIILLGTGFRYVIFNTDILDNFLGQNMTEEITTEVNNEANRFFVIDDGSEVKIFDKNDVSKPYALVTLPTPTEWSWKYYIDARSISPAFFESTWMYLVGGYIDLTNQKENPAILFYLTIDGNISKITTIDNLGQYNPSITIDQKNKKIYRIDSTQSGYNSYRCTLSMYDVTNSTYSSFTKDNLSPEQIIGCETNSKWFSPTISFKDNLVNVIFDSSETDTQTPYAKILTIDMEKNQIMSEVLFTEREQKQTSRISFTWDCWVMDPTTCTTLIDNIPISVPENVYIKTFINDTTLLAKTNTWVYIFISLESLQPLSK